MRSTMERARSRSKTAASRTNDKPPGVSANGNHARHGNTWSNLFSHAAAATAHLMGKPIAFLTAVALVVIWAASGPLFGFSDTRSEEHTSELQSQSNLVCRLLLE